MRLVKRAFVLLGLAGALVASPAAYAQYSDPKTDCLNPGLRPLLTTFTVARSTGTPAPVTATFAASSGAGLLCIENAGANAGGVTLNEVTVIAPDDFAQDPTLIARALSLEPANKIIANVAGQPGTSYVVRVYGEDPELGN